MKISSRPEQLGLLPRIEAILALLGPSYQVTQANYLCASCYEVPLLTFEEVYDGLHDLIKTLETK